MQIELHPLQIPNDLIKYFRPKRKYGPFILRNDIIWEKPNCMPSSVKDRFSINFEHIFFFVKSRKYFFEQQFEEYAESTKNDSRWGDLDYISNPIKKGYEDAKAQNPKEMKERIFKKGLSSGRNKRAVWKISTKPFKEAHFAVFCEDLIEIPIRAGCPEFVCNKCGKAREKIINSEYMGGTPYYPQHKWQKENGVQPRPRDYIAKKEIKGYSDCNCQAGFSGGIILDPFAGSGTTGIVARKQNKNFILIEMNPDYIKIAEKRLEPYLQQIQIKEFIKNGNNK